MEPIPLPELVRETRRDMLCEARRIVDAARRHGIALRLMGGIAVRAHCAEVAFCDRDHADIDMVGQGRQLRAITELFAGLGYAENLRTRLGTEGRQLQFTRACEHADAGLGVSAHPDDHVDVFLDTFKMDHELDLEGRLGLEDDYTLPVTDLLLTKLQIHTANEKDLRDILTLLKDRFLRGDRDDGAGRAVAGDRRAAGGQAGETGPGGDADQTRPDEDAGRPMIDVRHIAEQCARDWGLYYDVTANLARAAAALEVYELAADERARLRAALDRLRRAIEAAPKSRAWHRRAKVGTRKPWYNEVEDQDDEAA